jgi:hypothetical protein
MNFSLLSLEVRQVEVLYDGVKARVVARDTRGGEIPLIAVAYNEVGKQLESAKGSRIVARCELRPTADKFSPMRVDVRSILGVLPVTPKEPQHPPVVDDNEIPF